MPKSSPRLPVLPARSALRRLAAGSLVLALAVGVPTLASAQDEQDLAEAEDELAETRDELDATTADLADVADRIDVIEEDLAAAEARLDAISKEIGRTEADIEDLTLEALQLQETVGAARERIQEKARSLYTNGPEAPVMELFESATADRAIDRAAVMSRLADGDRSVAEQAKADRARLTVVSEELDQRKARLADLRTEANKRRDQVDAKLDEAAQLRDDLQTRAADLEDDEAALGAEIQRINDAIAARKAAEEAARRKAAEEAAAQQAAEEAAAQQAAEDDSSDSDSDGDSGGSTEVYAAAATSGGMACPLSGVTLYNDWGAPRGGGTRSHEGNDLVGSFRQNVYAITSGTWDVQSYGNSAGLWGILHGDDGNEYWYMHLNEHAVGDGSHVSAGDQVGYNGWSGNAVGTVYHVHFEYHPGGGGPVDPYGMLTGPC